MFLLAKYGSPNLYPRMSISAVLPPLASLYQQKSREAGGPMSPGLLLITVETKAKSRLGGIIPLSLSVCLFFNYKSSSWRISDE